MRIVSSVVLAAMAVLGTRSTAEACSCGTPGIGVRPSEKVAAPRNVQVRVTWPLPSGRMYGRPKPAPKEGEVPLDHGPWTESVRLMSLTGDEVASERRTMAAGELGMLLLTPRALLDADTTYHVVYEPEGATPVVLGQIHTGKHTLEAPPAWDGHNEAFLNLGAQGFDCVSPTPWVGIGLSPDPARDRNLAFGVWPEKGKMDSSTLLMIVSAWRDRVVLGNDSLCGLSNFGVSSSMRVTLRIAPIDLAGHVGAPAKVKIAPPKPTKPAPPSP